MQWIVIVLLPEDRHDYCGIGLYWNLSGNVWRLSWTDDGNKSLSFMTVFMVFFQFKEQDGRDGGKTSLAIGIHGTETFVWGLY